MSAQNLPDAAHPAVIARLLHDYDLHPKKSAGQNFFSDGDLLDKILRSAPIGPGDAVLEIGPGLGALTQRLAGRADRVAAVELDGDLLPVLRETLAGLTHVQVVHADFLRLSDGELCNLFTGYDRVHMVSNLPYCITTDAMQKLFRSRLPLASVTALVQKEAALRILAAPGEKQYGITAMMSRRYAPEGRILFDVPPECFFPRPGVTSAVVQLVFTQPRPEAACGEDDLWRVAKACIAQRRKTLRNNLTSGGFDRDTALAALAEAGIAPEIRAEVLDIPEILRLAEALYRR